MLHEALHEAMTSRLGTDRVMTVPERVDAVLEVSLGVMADDPAKRKRCLFLAVLAPGTLAPSDMLEDLWNEVRGGDVGSVRGVNPRTGALFHDTHQFLFCRSTLAQAGKGLYQLRPHFCCWFAVNVFVNARPPNHGQYGHMSMVWNAVQACLRECCLVWMT